VRIASGRPFRVRHVDPSTLIFLALVLFWGAVIVAIARFAIVRSRSRD
jgi:hypothetical protein